MALTYSQPMSVGTKAPDFKLPDTVSKKIFSLDMLQSKHATVVMFICNHCPFVRHIQTELTKVAKEYQSKGVSFIAISANDAQEYPDDAPEQMQKCALALGYSFPYLYDESQEVAKSYNAMCTPEFYVFDQDLCCAYHGRFDDSTPGKNIPVTGKDLRAALDAVLSKKTVFKQYPSMGCNIKWKK